MPGVDVHDVIQAHRRYLVELMQEWTRSRRTRPTGRLGFALVVDAELFRLDSVDPLAGRGRRPLRRAAALEPTPPSATGLGHCRSLRDERVGVRR